ncbi:hypothetical protein NDU88_002447 [Pleurodeles waltl]|uniref:Uncharacterized protein n=1 Tax=Pleurodeles waltl TaxID=8319 RepID=A0AAV7P6P2_PLEWA|nr:hypothetical protein NDU88_002447 [Pleurodeles waltl]
MPVCCWLCLVERWDLRELPITGYIPHRSTRRKKSPPRLPFLRQPFYAWDCFLSDRCHLSTFSCLGLINRSIQIGGGCAAGNPLSVPHEEQHPGPLDSLRLADCPEPLPQVPYSTTGRLQEGLKEYTKLLVHLVQKEEGGVSEIKDGGECRAFLGLAAAGFTDIVTPFRPSLLRLSAFFPLTDRALPRLYPVASGSDRCSWSREQPEQAASSAQHSG